MNRLTLLLAVPVALAVPARAQVSVDLHALDQVQGSHGGAATPSQGGTTEHRQQQATRQARPHPAAHAAKPAHPTPQPSQAAAKPAANAPAAALPTAPPPEVRLAPDMPAPPVNASPAPSIATAPPTSPALSAPASLAPSPPAAHEAAGSDVVTVGDGLRVTFQPGRSDLTAETLDMLHSFAQHVPDTAGASVDVRAYATGSPDDASESRRVSLSRSLAVRAALMAGGVSSTRIFVRALGANATDGPPDRVDVLLSRPAASATP